MLSGCLSLSLCLFCLTVLLFFPLFFPSFFFPLTFPVPLRNLALCSRAWQHGRMAACLQALRLCMWLSLYGCQPTQDGERSDGEDANVYTCHVWCCVSVALGALAALASPMPAFAGCGSHAAH